jgi:hypothetical protein
MIRPLSFCVGRMGNRCNAMQTKPASPCTEGRARTFKGSKARSHRRSGCTVGLEIGLHDHPPGRSRLRSPAAAAWSRTHWPLRGSNRSLTIDADRKPSSSFQTPSLVHHDANSRLPHHKPDAAVHSTLGSTTFNRIHQSICRPVALTNSQPTMFKGRPGVHPAVTPHLQVPTRS